MTLMEGRKKRKPERPDKNPAFVQKCGVCGTVAQVVSLWRLPDGRDLPMCEGCHVEGCELRSVHGSSFND